MEFKLSLSGIERQEELLRFVEQHQRATVTEMAEYLSVSLATVRRDLESLTEQGKIQRFHGGAIAVPKAPPELPALERETEQAEHKKRIGRAAAELVEAGDTIFLGSGTTVLEVARNLRQHRRLTVITNSLPVINILTDVPEINMVCLGGILRRSELSMIGHITEQALAEVVADKVIMGIRALDVERGLTNDYLPETKTDRSILGIGRKVIIVADHTKCGRVSTAFVAPITAIQTLVTDSNTSPDFIGHLTAKGIEVVTV